MSILHLRNAPERKQHDRSSRKYKKEKLQTHQKPESAACSFHSESYWEMQMWALSLDVFTTVLYQALVMSITHDKSAPLFVLVFYITPNHNYTNKAKLSPNELW